MKCRGSVHEPRDPLPPRPGQGGPRPGYHLHIGEGEVSAGGGIWHADTEAASGADGLYRPSNSTRSMSPSVSGVQLAAVLGQL